MSDQPGRGTVGSPVAPGHAFSAIPAPASSGDDADPVGDPARFDWFKQAGGHEQAAGFTSDSQPRRGLRGWLVRRRRGSLHSADAGVAHDHGRRRRLRGRGWLRGWRLPAAVTALALGCTVLGGVVGGLVAARSVNGLYDPSYSVGPVAAAPANRPADSVAGIAARDMPSVVMIKVDGNQGTGSGFIISGGYIVTDNHVVTLDGIDPATSLRIYFSNGRSVPGRLVGRDPYSDLAVIKPEGVTDLPALSLGNSDGVKVGDPVIAIGSPLGLADTVTSGIVSAMNRAMQPGAVSGVDPQVFYDAIQTDAPINPGNSGGPLVNARGQVIGVDAAIDTLGVDPLTGTQGGSIGLGFAIPIDQVRRVVVQLIRTGRATHSVIDADLNGNFSGSGAQIAAAGSHGAPAVAVHGPAARAGLRPGDVVVRVGNQPIASADALMDAIRSLPPGSRVEVTFIRHGQTLRTALTLGSAESLVRVRPMRAPRPRPHPQRGPKPWVSPQVLTGRTPTDGMNGD